MEGRIVGLVTTVAAHSQIAFPLASLSAWNVSVRYDASFWGRKAAYAKLSISGPPSYASVRSISG